MNDEQRIARIGELFARVDPQVLIIGFAPGTHDEIVNAHINIMNAIAQFYEILRSYHLHDFLKHGNYLHDWLTAGESDPNLLLSKIVYDLSDNIEIITTHDLEYACIVPLAEYTPHMVLGRQAPFPVITPPSFLPSYIPTPTILPSYVSDPARRLVLRYSPEPEMLEGDAPNLDPQVLEGFVPNLAPVDTEDVTIAMDTEDATMSDVENNPSVDVEMPPPARSDDPLAPVYPEMPPDDLPTSPLFSRPTPGPVPMSPAAVLPAFTPVAPAPVLPTTTNAPLVEIRDTSIPIDQRRVFICILCARGFTRAGDLARYWRTVHRGLQQQ
ncbi:hypothetical protein AUEXF2481DRAFT_25626 [Aureobasidium subglaciale EXF-2481]|uniref:C2H2-type domain-containing protein n=1 Tax=Aureobasidium subglaciale (strain EXF-2481) TaxID=1043005 RepID=A0A074YUA5_AURSE|nr:uncharacterized protein AUEXF2481DRAFT_25626 [Aureobasidium subglaciale EXF-2481]KAI5204585.1 hypothetical protein E4T38_04595 [Aureobasidium subglaciale]KAI5223784.1 hypothetical protein E4T40_04371 [Aureobasidium subglaciale]KAI5227090.1 hypothetical protein E4T41_04504 [Aureobasidium subglaciale]KAI5262579.1 hypothetical protein E4T46_04390 [Aureobasidium subglaciale]KEQ99744.1 hypothetical protein AUEXF2481DRAFT_25626 [Aureobasidium subglaciale EXF-2481]